MAEQNGDNYEALFNAAAHRLFNWHRAFSRHWGVAKWSSSKPIWLIGKFTKQSFVFDKQSMEQCKRMIKASEDDILMPADVIAAIIRDGLRQIDSNLN